MDINMGDFPLKFADSGIKYRGYLIHKKVYESYLIFISSIAKNRKFMFCVLSKIWWTDYICDAYITNKVRRWDIEGKKFFEIGEKYYFEDIGIRNSIIGYRPMDIGAILENAIYNKLSVDGHDIKVGVLSRNKEIDFVAEKDGERKYIQVAVNVYDNATADREFGNLESIGDNYEKLVVTLHDSAPNTQNGIKMLSLRDFLNMP